MAKYFEMFNSSGYAVIDDTSSRFFCSRKVKLSSYGRETSWATWEEGFLGFEPDAWCARVAYRYSIPLSDKEFAVALKPSPAAYTNEVCYCGKLVGKTYMLDVWVSSNTGSFHPEAVDVVFLSQMPKEVSSRCGMEIYDANGSRIFGSEERYANITALLTDTSLPSRQVFRYYDRGTNHLVWLRTWGSYSLSTNKALLICAAPFWWDMYESLPICIREGFCFTANGFVGIRQFRNWTVCNYPPFCGSTNVGSSLLGLLMDVSNFY